MATNQPPAAAAQPPAGNLGLLQNLLDKYKPQIAVALPRHLTPERMIRIALTAVSQTPKLRECNPYTICGAIVQASILGLEPNSTLGEAFLIPYWNKKANNEKGGYDCQLQVGYKGHVKLARNSGEIAMIDAQPVCEGDTFEFEKGDTPYLKHKWGKSGKRGAIIGYWAGFKTKDGTFNFEYWTIEDIHQHRDLYTKSKDRAGKIYGPWVDNPDWMCRKTVLIQVLKLAPKSVQLATALAVDENPHAAFSLDVPLELQPATEDSEPTFQVPRRTEAPIAAAAATEPAKTQAPAATEDLKPEPKSTLPDWSTLSDLDDWPDDPFAPAFGRRIIVQGKRFQRASPTEDNWKDVTAKKAKEE